MIGKKMMNHLFCKSYTATKVLITRRICIEFDRIPHHFQNVPLKKIFNWICAETSLFRKPNKPWGWPTHIMIEPSAYCNLSCPLCPVTKGLKRPKGYMDFQLFKKIIDEIGEYLFFVLLWDWGEPFLNPSIFNMIMYANQRGIKTISCSNGHPFTKDENVDNLIGSGLDTLIIAMDGVHQETYERYRQGGNLNAVLHSIQTIVARKRKIGSKKPFVNLRFIVMKQNEHEIPEVKDLAKSMGVDALTFFTLNPYIDKIYGESPLIKNTHEDELLPENNHYKRFKMTQDGQARLRLKRNPCKHLWNNPVIHWDGTVCPCTYDYQGKYILGDLKKESFKNIWYGTPYQSLRNTFRKEWENLDLCRECSYGYAGGDLGREAIAEALFFNSTSFD